MREGKGKWVDSNGVIYEGKYFDILVQAISNKILNMVLEDKLILLAKNMRDSLSKAPENKVDSQIKILTLFKYQKTEHFFVFYLFKFLFII